MKKFILSLGLVVSAALYGFAQTPATTGPIITLDKDVHDYGTIDQGADGTCKFIVTNTGTEPLIMERCKGSCGCTVPKCDKAPIMPGESSEISVKYDTKRLGAITKSVTITSNAVNEPNKVIRIKGNVVGTEPAGGAPVKTSPSGAPVNE
jgi:hypothetical protein